ncbi:3-hydroxy-3-methylglutaryl-CoA reductase [Photobacterium rosenbergii]|uniref:hydroxymethylglutaryl-CoA reductase (NADPH) n=1 Tax=Photobacterium rosenbergii TaxID=294936 RepID=A0A2T3NJI0_9GAMM|nr:hydroxymethylglutaryl-CoA reductase [Photobacterium rosenbergii]PSW15658.1 3-hydroxy-3-methylglutaryl-CoA reductase [Photobacterium rosenbergii]
MPKLNLHRRDHMKTVVNDFTADELQQRLGSNFAKPENKQPRTPYLTPKAVERRWQMLDNEEAKAQLLDGHTQEQMLCYNKNIENFIGTVKMPIGIAGPLRVNGLFAQNDFHVPLATTEAALVASYNRGSQLITQAGGASAMLLNEGVTRTPCFAFYDLAQAGQFVAWVVTQYDEFRRIAESTTRHGKLADISVNIEGNHVYLVFEYLTGDASGQNMVTISTNAVFEHILHHSPITPLEAFLDGNLSGDKKATAQTLRGVRGKKVTAEVNIDKELVEKMLHTTPQKMAEFARMNTIGGTLSGSIGINAHYANALAAFYIACGQDAACVAESAVGITRIEVNQHGGLYASVTLPNLMVGTVGGGTSLPSQKACLDLLGLHGSGNSQALSEVCAALCLAGELSIVGAFCAGHFSRAHHKLAR